MMHVRTDFSSELTFLIAACIGLPIESHSTSVINGAHLFNLARWHNVRPQLLSAVQGNTESWITELRQECLEITLSNLINTRETIRVVKILEENQIPVYAYKGCVWAEWLYGQQGRREFGDIDLLVAAEHLSTALKLTSAAGYTPDSYRSHLLNGPSSVKNAFIRTDYHIPMERQVAESTLKFMLEVHWRVAYPRLNFHFPATEWFSNEAYYKIQDESVRSFSNEYQFLLLLMHHGGKERWSKLKYVADLAAYLSKYGHETNWPKVNQMAGRKGMIKLVHYSLGVLRGLGLEWKSEWPDVTPITLPTSVLSKWENMPKTPQNSTWAYFRHALAIRDSFSDRWEIGKLHLSYASEMNLLYHKARWYFG